MATPGPRHRQRGSCRALFGNCFTPALSLSWQSYAFVSRRRRKRQGCHSPTPWDAPWSSPPRLLQDVTRLRLFFAVQVSLFLVFSLSTRHKLERQSYILSGHFFLQEGRVECACVRACALVHSSSSGACACARACMGTAVAVQLFRRHKLPVCCCGRAKNKYLGFSRRFMSASV